MTNNARTVIFPGTFDPITNGHLDVIRRATEMFDRLIVAVGYNPEKTPLLSLPERVGIIEQAVSDLKTVEVRSFTGLTVDFARQVGACAILRGIRNSSDLQYEFQVALTNRAVAGVETVFVMTSPELAFTSSSLIKQIASMGGDVSSLVPPEVLEHIRARQAEGGGDENLQESP
jgi:pantetheine-phosphate adenylyltransferase